MATARDRRFEQFLTAYNATCQYPPPWQCHECQQPIAGYEDAPTAMKIAVVHLGTEWFTMHRKCEQELRDAGIV